MNPQSNTKQTPSPSALRKGSVNGNRREVSTDSFSADGKCTAAGVDLSLDLSPSLPRSMSLLAISQVSLSLSLSVLLSVSLSCSLSLSLSIFLPHTSCLPFFPSLCVFLGLCASSLSLYPDAVKLSSLLQSNVFASRLICRARTLCSLSFSLSTLCVSLNLFLSLSLSLSVPLFPRVLDLFQRSAGVTIAAASKAIPNVLEEIASSGSSFAAAGNMFRPTRKLGFTKSFPGQTSAVKTPAVSPPKVLAGFTRKPEGCEYKAQPIVRESHVRAQTCLDQTALNCRREAFLKFREETKAKEQANRNASNLLERRKRQQERAAKADAVDWAFSHKDAPIVRRGRGRRGQVQFHVRDAGRYSGSDRMQGGLERRNMSRDNHLVSINMQAKLSGWVGLFSIPGSISVSLLAPSVFSLALRSLFLLLCSLYLSRSLQLDRNKPPSQGGFSIYYVP